MFVCLFFLLFTYIYIHIYIYARKAAQLYLNRNHLRDETWNDRNVRVYIYIYMYGGISLVALTKVRLNKSAHQLSF